MTNLVHINVIFNAFNSTKRVYEPLLFMVRKKASMKDKSFLKITNEEISTRSVHTH